MLDRSERIILVEDDQVFAQVITRSLEKRGFSLHMRVTAKKL